jgi:hypothetical protein
MTHKRLIGVAGLTAWVMVGLPSWVYHAGASAIDWRWTAAFLIFGAAFAVDYIRPQLGLLVVESAAAISLIYLSCNSYEGTLLVVAAIQLGPRLGRMPGVIWLLTQTLVLAAVLSVRLGLRFAVALAPPYLGFQLLAFFCAESHGARGDDAQRAGGSECGASGFATNRGGQQPDGGALADCRRAA